MDIIIILASICCILAIWCYGQDCPPLDILELKHGRILRHNRFRLRFLCQKGFYLAGPQFLHCRKGNWSSSTVPKCMKAQHHCHKLPEIPNAKLWGEDTHIGARARYMCNPGYHLMGEGIRRCLPTLGWSGLTPICKDEKDLLAEVAARMENDFVSEVGSHSMDSRARSLDDESLMNGLELVFLVDSSSSIDPKDFEQAMGFLKFLLDELGVKNGDNFRGTRVALIAFADKADIIYNLDDVTITDTEEAKKRIDVLQPNGGGTNLDAAFQIIFSAVNPILRESAKKAIFIITDGQPNVGQTGEPLEVMAAILRKMKDYEIFTLGIGNDVDKKQLANLSSEPALSHVFLLNRYSDFKDILTLIKYKPTPKPTPGPEACGYIPESELHSTEHTWPWIAAIYIQNEDHWNPPLSFCVGSLICKQWVLTSAHCFYRNFGFDSVPRAEKVFVTLGQLNIAQPNAFQTNFYALELFIHPNFTSEDPSSNNLALLKLNPSESEKSTFRPVCLPDPGRKILLSMDQAIIPKVVGWGTESLSDEAIDAAGVSLEPGKVDLPLAGETSCIEKLGRKNVKPDTFCAGYGSSVNGSCRGNTGSPLVAQDPKTEIHHIIGVITEKRWCSGKYTLFSRVHSYLEWINEVTHNCRALH